MERDEHGVDSIVDEEEDVYHEDDEDDDDGDALSSSPSIPDDVRPVFIVRLETNPILS